MNFNDLLQTAEKSKRQFDQVNKTLRGKLCYFWNEGDSYKRPALFGAYDPGDSQPFRDEEYFSYSHCRPLTREEVESLLYKE